MIESYSFGRIVVDDEEYNQDLIVFPDEIKSNWWRKEGHKLCPSDLKEVIEKSPKVLVVGTGANGRMKVPEDTRDYLEEHGIEMIVEKTERACERYNELVKTENAAAALHLTC